MIPAALAHGGADSPNDEWDGCQRAVDAALEILAQDGTAVDAAVAATLILEDDPRFNAGTGSRVRLDGITVQMDAAIMGSDGRFGGVAAIERVQHPILVAREVLESPHLLVVGDGATTLARRLGLPDYDPTVPAVQEDCDRIRRALADGTAGEAWQDYDWRRAWNYDVDLAALGLDRHSVGGDTVGCTVRDRHGNFAAALSTGGTATTLRGRVGDSCIFGAGLYAGTHGALAATGEGERIVEATLALRGHDDLVRGKSAAQVVAQAIDNLGPRGAIGLLVMTSSDMAAGTATTMAWAGRELGSDHWRGPSR
ncbi:MAG: isoaspartyl peptidase/L-asparaginase [Myxococcales bacterium]|nr:isoaspartyl peptidase/L-asparaginase [Myxococcales bacterium]